MPSISSPARTNLFIILTAVTIGITCYIVGLKVFHHAPLTTDEGSYVFQAVNFSEGRIARDAPPFGRLLQHRMIIQDNSVGWFSRYAPAHSIWLIPGVIGDDPYVMPALAATLSALLLMLTARTIGARIEPIPLMLLCSPYFLFMHGTLLSHTSGLLFTSLAIWGYLNWKNGAKTRWAVVAGLGLGLMALGRSYTALLIAVPMGIDALLVLYRKPSRKIIQDVALLVSTAGAGGIALLFYNYLAVGDPFTMTFLYYDPNEGLGFGLRDNRVDHTLGRGLQVLWDNLKLFDLRLLGWHGSLILLSILFIFGWTSSISGWFALTILAVPLGYILFWFEGVPEVGPVYYFEMYPFLILGACLGLTRLVNSVPWPPIARAVSIVSAVLVLFAGAMLHIRDAAADLDPNYRTRRALRDTILSAPLNSIVFLPSMPHQPFLMLNAYGLQTVPLVAIQFKGEWVGLTRLFPEHRYFRLDQKPTPRLFPLLSPPLFKVHRSAKSFDREPVSANGKQLTGGDASIANPTSHYRFSRPVWVCDGDFVARFYFDTKEVPATSSSEMMLEIRHLESGHTYVRRQVELKQGQDHVDLLFSASDISMVELTVEYAPSSGNTFLGSSIEEINE